MPGAKNQVRLAVLMTCHNRVAHTTACLHALKQQEGFAGLTDLFIVDDGSTDGTDRAILEIFPKARLLKGDGSLFWAGGMRRAFAEAILGDYDFYLWLNDDTQLLSDAIARIHQTYRDASDTRGESIIVIGSTCEEGKEVMSYGGWKLSGGVLSLMRWHKTQPGIDRWITCDTMNGNCVFIPRAVMKVNGNIDASYTHSMGDMDYGLRAKKVGCEIVVSPGFYGFCSLNDGAGLWTDVTLPLLERWQRLLGPKGLPLREWQVFTRRHAGRLWVVNWLWPYLKFWINALVRGLKIRK